ncbi:MAG TPA: transcription termination factor Rho [Streptosporangiaceae bacterium]|jgi:transcription termination factor Rho|nr:transcription termination factor Rho [Streptosporangiaceae bacterium]
MTTITEQKSARSHAAEITEDTSFAVSGILDIEDDRAFLRTSGYRPGDDDVYVSPAVVRQHGLRRGDHIDGAARTPRPGQSNQSGQAARRNAAAAKHPGLVRVDAVNGMEPAQAKDRPDFDALTPLYPQERLRLESGSASPTARIIDLISPIGKGQRGMIVSPPKAGKTMVLAAIAAAIAEGYPDVHLMLVLVGERPEEVTDLQRTVRGEVVYSTFDQAARDHIAVAELAIERARRVAELGRDVVVLLDSITRLGRAYNLVAPASSRILTGGVAVSALQPPRKFLGSARNLEDGGSLTILSTALVDTGSRMDDVFFEEFKGTGNMELRLRRDLAEKRIYPAVDVSSSGTRRDDLLMPPEEHAAADRLRRVLAGLEPQQALELLLGKTRETASNAEFLIQVQRSNAA